jgi:predicted PurR-regulated permease PerM
MDRGAEVRALSTPGKPFSRHTPFFVGLTAAFGVAVAFLVVRVVIDAGQILSLVGLALFLAIGLNPAVAWLADHHVPRWAGVVTVTLTLLLLVGGFVAAAVGPITSEIHELSVRVPNYVHDIKTGQGWIGHLAVRFHINNEVKTFSPSKLISGSSIGGVIGAGKFILSAFGAVTAVCILTLYFLVSLPAIRSLWLHFVPKSRRDRVAALGDEIFSRVGGFVLGNIVTSIVSGILTTVWLAIFGVPYPILLGLLVALLDLVPIIGSTIGGLIASLVALTRGLPIAIGTAVFFIAYRLIEDYLLTPRVMRHTVRLSPGLTVVASLIGAVLLGFIGAVIAIPAAAGIRLLLEEVTFPSLERK